MGHQYIFFAAVLFCFVDTLFASIDELSPRRSSEFFSNVASFHCPSTDCPNAGSKKLYFHTVVGTEHSSSYILLVNKICEVFQLCIPKENILILLHKSKAAFAENRENYYALSVDFLEELGIRNDEWEGVFSAETKMLASYKTLGKLRDENKIIYQTDIDEVPQSEDFQLALSSLMAGKCDVIKGQWKDRLSLSGELTKLQINSTLDQQYPLRCKISDKFVGGGRVSKSLAYRANYRLDGGHHEIWCNIYAPRLAKWFSKNSTLALQTKMRQNTRWEMSSMCSQHIRERGKGHLLDRIMSFLPVSSTMPRICEPLVTLDHFKFVDGLREYIWNRYLSYRKQGMRWWVDSWRFASHIDAYNNSVCVNCKQSECYYASRKKKVRVNKSKIFYCSHYTSCPKNISLA